MICELADGHAAGVRRDRRERRAAVRCGRRRALALGRRSRSSSPPHDGSRRRPIDVVRSAIRCGSIRTRYPAARPEGAVVHVATCWPTDVRVRRVPRTPAGYRDGARRADAPRGRAHRRRSSSGGAGPGPSPTSRSSSSRPSPTRPSSPSRTCGCSRSCEARNRDLTEALEQQTATSEILRVISQLADRRAAGLRHDREQRAAACAAPRRPSCSRFDGELIQLVGAATSVTAGGAEAIARALPDAGRPRQRRDRARVLTRALVAYPGRARRRRSTATEHIARAGGFRSILAVPMLREGQPIGAIAVGASGAWRVSRRRRSRCCRPSPTRR